MANKFTIDDIAKMQQRNKRQVQNNVIPSLKKSVGGVGGNTYTPSLSTQQAPKITAPVVKPVAGKTVNLGGKTYSVSNNLNSNQSISIPTNNFVSIQKSGNENKKGYKYGSDNPIAALGASALLKMGSAVEGAQNIVKGYKDGDNAKLDKRKYDERTSMREGGTNSLSGKALKNAVKYSSLPGMIASNKIGDDKFKTTEQTAYNLAGGLADMGADYLTGVLTRTNKYGMGVQSGLARANEAQSEAIARGKDVKTATTYAVLSGLLEGAMNTIGLNKVEEVLSKNALSTGQKIATSAGIEGAEEGLQAVLEDVADNIVNRKNSEDYMMYQGALQNGMSKSDAIKFTVMNRAKEIGFSELIGTAFGGVLSAGKLMFNNSANPELETALDETLPDIDTSYVDFANSIGEDIDATVPVSNARAQLIAEARAENPQLLDRLSDEDVYNYIQSRNEMPEEDLANQNYNILYNVMNNTDSTNTLPVLNNSADVNSLDVMNNTIPEVEEFVRQNPALAQNMSTIDILNYIKAQNSAPTVDTNAPTVDVEQTENNTLGNGGMLTDAEIQALLSGEESPHAMSDEDAYYESMAQNFVPNEESVPTLAPYQSMSQPSVQPTTSRARTSVPEMYRQNIKVDNGVKFANAEDNAAYRNNISEMRKAINRLYNGQFESREEVSNLLDEIDRLDREHRTITSRGQKEYRQDNGKKALREQYYELSKGDKILLDDRLKAELQDMNILNANNSIRVNRKPDALGFTTDTSKGIPADTYFKNRPQLAALLGIDESMTSADQIARLMEFAQSIKGETYTSEIGEATTPLLTDEQWNDIANQAGIKATEAANKIPRVGKNIVMAAEKERPTRVDMDSEMSVAAQLGLEGANEVAPVRQELPQPTPTNTTLEGGSILNEKFSRVASNTGVNNMFWTREEMESDPTIRAISTYANDGGEETSFNEAMDRVSQNAQQWETDYVNGTKSIETDSDVDTAMIILTDINNKLNDARAYNDTQTVESLTARKNLLFSRLRAAGTKSGREIQAFAKWNRTSDGAQINADRILVETAETYAKHNSRKAERCNKLAKALADMGNKDAYKVKERTPKTHEQIREGVVNVLADEYGSVENYFNDTAINQITAMVESNIPTWQLTDEITHFLNHGEFYSLDESTPKSQPNKKLESAFRRLVDEGVAPEKEMPSLDEIKAEVKESFNSGEYSSIAKNFDESDADYIANLIYNGATQEEIATALNTKLATGIFGISPEAQELVNYNFEMASKYEPGSKACLDYQTEAYRVLAEELTGTGTFADKFTAWRYLSMLGNLKTHERNIIGNTIFQAMTGTSNNIAAVLESLVDKATAKRGGIERTKSVLNWASAQDRALISNSYQDAESSIYERLSGQKYNDGIKGRIESQINPFNNTKLGKYTVGKAYTLNNNALEAEDFFAVRQKYATSLAGYLKANGADASIFNDPNNELLVRARDYAASQAEYAAFHEDNIVATKLSKLSSDWRKSDNVAAHAMSRIIEGLMPYKKTPMNILRSSVEYSPANALKDINLLVKAIRGRDNVKVADYLDSLSKTITGTGVFLLGALLKSKGLVNTKNDETNNQDRLEGMQNYSLRIGDYTYTIDNFAPLVPSLFAGAEAFDKIVNQDGNSLEDFWNTITSSNVNLDDVLNSGANVMNDAVKVGGTLLDPLVETSMLSGVRDTFEDVARNVQQDDNLGALGTFLATPTLSYFTQGVPTLLGQAARSIDPIRRDTYSDKSGFASDVDYQLNKIQNKIPGLSQFNEPYYDTYGRTERNSPFSNPVANAAYQFLSPVYVDKVERTDADRLARKVSANNDGNTEVFATKRSYKKVDDKRVSPKDYATYSRESGQANRSIREYLADNTDFDKLDKATQVSVLKDINGVADKIGESKINKNFASDDKLYNAYLENKEKGVADYLVKTGILNDKASDYKNKDGKPLKFSQLKNTQKAEVTQELVKEGTMSYEDTLDYYSDSKLKSYFEDKGEKGAKLYNELIINGTDENGSINAYSVLPTLRKSGMSDKENGELLYGIASKTDLPKLDNVKSMYGYSGVYDYYDYRNRAANQTDVGNNNGKLDSKAEITGFLDKQNMSQSERKAWFDIMKGGRNWKNPY